MFCSSALLIERFVAALGARYRHMYSNLEPDYPGIIEWAGTTAMEIIANSDALYHDVEHSMMVTLVGQEILRGKHQMEGGVSPRDWVNFTVSLLCHDVGYVRGICPRDTERAFVIDAAGTTVALPPGASDASLTPYHVERGKLFVRKRFEGHPVIDAEQVAANIEHTRFPVPSTVDRREAADYPGLVRAADLIGQLADPDYLRKLPALYYEFVETGAQERLGYHSHEDLRRGYPAFFWSRVAGPVAEGLRYLRVTREGRQWIANLYAHVFSEEHGALL